ncbi:hypothetical protein EJ08DRAFT_699213 [Tothia fuscella]|uniref:Uncharacterized protein n=1 Tax=Tothia fuscella TaxID=1048955 RepID=A0A9P4NNP8_9PEZI|nr:hypothetical protein EJ08DRAFT_699213 [Tothia fuscella]
MPSSPVYEYHLISGNASEDGDDISESSTASCSSSGSTSEEGEHLAKYSTPPSSWSGDASERSVDTSDKGTPIEATTSDILAGRPDFIGSPPVPVCWWYSTSENTSEGGDDSSEQGGDDSDNGTPIEVAESGTLVEASPVNIDILTPNRFRLDPFPWQESWRNEFSHLNIRRGRDPITDQYSGGGVQIEDASTVITADDIWTDFVTFGFSAGFTISRAEGNGGVAMDAAENEGNRSVDCNNEDTIGEGRTSKVSSDKKFERDRSYDDGSEDSDSENDDKVESAQSGVRPVTSGADIGVEDKLDDIANGGLFTDFTVFSDVPYYWEAAMDVAEDEGHHSEDPNNEDTNDEGRNNEDSSGEVYEDSSYEDNEDSSVENFEDDHSHTEGCGNNDSGYDDEVESLQTGVRPVIPDSNRRRITSWEEEEQHGQKRTPTASPQQVEVFHDRPFPPTPPNSARKRSATMVELPQSPVGELKPQLVSQRPRIPQFQRTRQPRRATTGQVNSDVELSPITDPSNSPNIHSAQMYDCNNRRSPLENWDHH